MKLQTPGLILRPWQESDAENLYEYAKDPIIGHFAGWPPHTSIEDSLKVIRECFLTRNEDYAVCQKKDNKAVGCIKLAIGKKGPHSLCRSESEGELGFWIGKPFWGQGLIPEAAGEILRYGFEDLKLNTVWCGCMDDNTRSKRVQEKLGFVYSHTCKNYYIEALNQWCAQYVVSCLTLSRWQELKAKVTM